MQELFLAYGPVGVFIAAIIANATILFPVPLDIFMLGLGAFMQGADTSIVVVFLMGLVAGIGAAIGEMTSYILGLSGISAIERAKHRQFAKLEYVDKRLSEAGMAFIAIGAFTPFPFDLIGIVCGMLKYDWKKFFIAALIGKIPRYLLVVFAGYFGWSFLRVYLGF